MRVVADARGIDVTQTSETWGRGLRFGIVPLRNELTYWFTALPTQAASSPLETIFAGWHDGRVVLLGDAADAMTPNLGQGAAQAVQDAAALVDALSQHQVPAALKGYERRCKRHAEMVVRRSRTAGRVAQAAGPMASRLRDVVTRAAPRARGLPANGRHLAGVRP